MGRRIERLTLDHLAAADDALPGCRSCLFWELDPVRAGRLADDRSARCEEKDAWLSEVLREWGSCGRVALVGERPVGLVVYAPPAHVPGAAGFATAPVSADAVLMTTLRVAPEHAGGGLGRMLVQGMARDLIGRGGVRAVEAFGSRGPERPCTVPAAFLDAVGFRTQRPHPTTPRMRMDLRSLLTWRDEVEAALERLLGVVRPKPAPAPETGVGRAPGTARRAGEEPDAPVGRWISR